MKDWISFFKVWFLFLSMGVVLVGCNATTAGTDTGNPMVVALVQDSAGNPLAGAKVYLYRQNATTGTAELVTTLETDADGLVSYVAADSLTMGMEVYWQDQLGAYQLVTPQYVPSPSSAVPVNVMATKLVSFSVQENADVSGAYFSETGRVFLPGVPAKVPSGLWSVYYINYGANLADTLQKLSVPVEVARDVPEALTGLTTAARNLDSMNIITKGFAAFSAYDSIALGLVRERILETCLTSSYVDITLCANGADCRIWQWQSDWVSLDTTQTQALYVGAVTGEGRNLCLFFSDQALDGSGASVIIPFDEARKRP